MAAWRGILGAPAVVVTMAGAAATLAAPRGAGPIRLHQASGWGRPGVDAQTVYYLSSRHELFAIDRRWGTERWRQSLTAGVAGATAGSIVAIADRVVVAGDGGLFAFDAGTGHRRWQLADGHDGVRSPGRFIGAVGSAVIWTGSASGHVQALDVRDGAAQWRSRVASDASTVFGPVEDGTLLLAAFTDFGATPRSGGIVAVDTRTGAVRWRTWFVPRVAQLPASASGPPLVVDGVVMAAATDGVVYGMDRRDGRVIWTLPPEGTGGLAANEDFRVLAVAARRLIVTSLSGVLTALDLRSRNERWRFASPRDGSIAFGLVAHGPLLYVPFASGRLAVVDAASGAMRRMVGTPSRRFDWPPTVVGEQAYLVSEDGLYVFDAGAP
ncbi:MAG: PQQ-binding-like beta-propeller repeat protein [Vicinamibacterales bacterium]